MSQDTLQSRSLERDAACLPPLLNVGNPVGQHSLVRVRVEIIWVSGVVALLLQASKEVRDRLSTLYVRTDEAYKICIPRLNRGEGYVLCPAWVSPHRLFKLKLWLSNQPLSYEDNPTMKFVGTSNCLATEVRPGNCWKKRLRLLLVSLHGGSLGPGAFTGAGGGSGGGVGSGGVGSGGVGSGGSGVGSGGGGSPTPVPVVPHEVPQSYTGVPSAPVETLQAPPPPPPPFWQSPSP